jgi:hypothetical protein
VAGIAEQAPLAVDAGLGPAVTVHVSEEGSVSRQAEIASIYTTTLSWASLRGSKARAFL